MEITNATLSRFIAVKAEISRLEKEADTIKKALITKGEFETDEFTVEIPTITKFITIDADTLCTILDPVFVSTHNLIKTITYPMVKVKAKLKKAA